MHSSRGQTHQRCIHPLLWTCAWDWAKRSQASGPKTECQLIALHHEASCVQVPLDAGNDLATLDWPWSHYCSKSIMQNHQPLSWLSFFSLHTRIHFKMAASTSENCPDLAHFLSLMLELAFSMSCLDLKVSLSINCATLSWMGPLWLILGRPLKDLSRDFFSRRDIVFLFGTWQHNQGSCFMTTHTSTSKSSHTRTIFLSILLFSIFLRTKWSSYPFCRTQVIAVSIRHSVEKSSSELGHDCLTFIFVWPFYPVVVISVFHL